MTRSFAKSSLALVRCICLRSSRPFKIIIGSNLKPLRLEGHPSHHLAKKYSKKGFGGVISFGIKGGAAAGTKVLDSFRLISHVGNVGDAKTLALHPWSTTHEQLKPEERIASGVTEDLIRRSVGLEHITDIIADF